MSHSSAVPSSVKRHSGGSSSQVSERGDVPIDASQHSVSSHHHHYHHHYDPEWEAKEELRLRELEEARARAAQMEKTMRWWSDCTANWREKWSKVRTERNRAREEARVMRGKLEAATKEVNTLKREKQELESENVKLQKEIHFLQTPKTTGDKKEEGKFNSLNSSVGERVVAERDVSHPEKPTVDIPASNSAFLSTTLDSFSTCSKSVTKPEGTTLSQLSSQTVSQDLEFLDKLFHNKENQTTNMSHNSGSAFSSFSSDSKEKKSRTEQKLVENVCSPVQELVDQRVSMLQLRLDEATKTILAERQEKNKLIKNLEKLQSEMAQLQGKYEDIKRSKQDTLKELTQIKTDHQDELDSVKLDLEDETNSRTSLDQRIGELRTELERLQAENALEWGKRERLETEKFALERENKKFKTQIQDLEERLERKTKQMTSANDSDVKTLQMELHDKNKELNDLKHAHGKVKKILQDKSTELAHALRRLEQYETEVKKLRGRVEELKKELATAEDDVDIATNNIRKLQRTNDELQEHVDSLEVQVEHLQSRKKDLTTRPPVSVKEQLESPAVDPSQPEPIYSVTDAE